MKPSRRISMLAVSGLAIGWLAAGALAQTPPPRSLAGDAKPQLRYLLAGGETGAWIVYIDQAQSAFGLLHKNLGGKWEWIGKAADMDGTPAIAQSIGDSLQLVFPQGDYVMYSVIQEGWQSFPGQKISGKTLAACAAAQAPGGVQSLVLILSDVSPNAVKSRSDAPTSSIATSSPTGTQAMAGTGTPRLGAYQTTGQGLTLLAPMDDLAIRPSARIMPAMANNGTLFLLVSDPPSPNRLLAWRNGQWQQISLDDRLANATMLANLALPDGRLALLLAETASGGDTSQPAMQITDLRTLTIAGTSDQGVTFHLQPIARQGVPATWPAESLPHVCLMAKNLLLLWRGQDSPQLATADLEGRIISTESMDILAGPPKTSYADVVANYFLWTVVVAIFFTLFMVRPVGPPKPFTLIDTVRPANLFKRLLAAMVDFMPFSMIAAAIFQPPMISLEEMMTAGAGHPPDAYLYASITTLSLYVVYCILMEFYFAATVGKMIFRLRVVGDETRRAGLREIVLRNLTKIVELLPVWPGLPIPLLLLAPLLTSKRQRIGDMLAKTAVVDAATLPGGQPLPAANNEQYQPPAQTG